MGFLDQWSMWIRGDGAQRCWIGLWETGLNQIYYWVYKSTTCHHYTNIIKNSLINLIKIRSLFTIEKGLA